MKPKKDFFGQWGLVDENDEWIVQPLFDKIEPYRGKYAKAVMSGKPVFVDRDGYILDEIPWFDKEEEEEEEEEKYARSPLDIFMDGCNRVTDILHKGLKDCE